MSYLICTFGPDVADRADFDFVSRDAPAGPAWALRAVVEQVAAVALLILLLPFFVAIILAIRIETPGPALFRQPRFGRDRRSFEVLKFRTMCREGCDRSGAGQTADRDPRITRVGTFLRRSSLDELPQLINVIRGEMSLVGPRAHPCGMEVCGRLCDEVDPRYHARHVVRPGITGWAQVNGSRGAVKSPEALRQRVDLDLDYVARWSPLLDLWILVRTLAVAIHPDAGG